MQNVIHTICDVLLRVSVTVWATACRCAVLLGVSVPASGTAYKCTVNKDIQKLSFNEHILSFTNT